MKIKAIGFLLLIPCIGLCQQKQPTYYLDSVKIDMEKVTISPNSMSNLEITHNTPEGEVYISVKRNTKFFTLSQIVSTHNLFL